MLYPTLLRGALRSGAWPGGAKGVHDLLAAASTSSTSLSGSLKDAAGSSGVRQLSSQLLHQHSGVTCGCAQCCRDGSAPTAQAGLHPSACVCLTCRLRTPTSWSTGPMHRNLFSFSASRHADKQSGQEAKPGDSSSDDEAAKASSSSADAQQPAGEQAAGAEQPSPEQLAASLKQKEEEVAALKQEVTKLTEQVKYKMAEFVNLRERTDREKKDKEKFAIQGFAKAILDVADNLERAAAAVPADVLADGNTADAEQLRKLLKSLLDGVAVTEKGLLNVFKQNHLQQFNPVNEKFNPNEHNAMFEMADPSKEDGTVAVVVKRGYKLHDRVIRPADVGVVKNASS